MTLVLPVPAFNKFLNDPVEVNANFSYLDAYFASQISHTAFSPNLSGNLTFAGPAIVITSSGALAGPVLSVAAAITAIDSFTIAATNAFLLSSTASSTVATITGKWVATGGSITAGAYLVAGVSAAAKYGSYAVGSLPTPSGPAITWNTTNTRLEAYSSGWTDATASWVTAPLSVVAGVLTVGAGPSIGSYSRGRGTGSGTSTATVTDFVKNRAVSPLLVFAHAGVQKTTGIAESSGYTVTLTLKRGATVLDTITYTMPNETTGLGNGSAKLWTPKLPSEPAGTNNYSVELTHDSGATVVTKILLSVVEL